MSVNSTSVEEAAAMVSVTPPSSPPISSNWTKQQQNVYTPGTQFNRKKIGLSFGLKNRLRFHFDSETCLNYLFLNVFLSVGESEAKTQVIFSSQKLKPKIFY